MAQYRLSNSIISRSKAKSSVAAAAYRSGSILNDDRLGVTHDYSKKRNIAWTMILAPETAPGWVYDRQALWNRVEAREFRRDSQVARECLVSLPNELTLEQNIVLVRDFAIEEFVSKGMIADMAVHDIKGNPHAHILLTMRELEADGFGLKNREWNGRSLLREQRQSWADHCNQALEAAGRDERVDPRTLQEQGIIRIPQIHLGSHAAQCLKQQKYHPRLERYFEIERANAELSGLQDGLLETEAQIQADTQQQFEWADQILPIAKKSIEDRIEAGTAIDCGNNRWAIRPDHYQIFLAQPNETEWELEIYSQHGSLANGSGQEEQQTVRIDQGFTVEDHEYFVRLHQLLLQQQQIQEEQERLERERRDREHREQQRLEQERLQQVCQPYQQIYDRIAGAGLPGETNEQRDLRVADQAYQTAIAQGFDINQAQQSAQHMIGYGGAIGQSQLFQSGTIEALRYAEPIAQQAANNWQDDQAEQILSTAIDFFRNQTQAGRFVEMRPNEFAVECDRFTLIGRLETMPEGERRSLSVVIKERGEIARCRKILGNKADEWQVEVGENIEPNDTRIFKLAASWLQQQQTVSSPQQPQLELG